ncbi:MAG: TonB-dependent receptor [Saprospiraceae bacterium]|nr:TonB-dependent receptor [Saprospiraceae bacterium]
MKRLLLLIFGIHLAHLLAAHNGSINGQILEKPTGLELPGALIKIEPLGVSTTSNDLGFFVFQNLPAGFYNLTINYLGFETRQITNLEVRDAETTTLKIELAPAPILLKDVAVSTTSGEPFRHFSALDIRIRPVNTTQDVLRIVPGLFIAQHAGGGKAEQIFLRGFDIDHGTDINLSVDGMPVNMVSHAHGQGYADLHFVIPELIETVDFKKGPYAADGGNFTTAGMVRFKTIDAPVNNLMKIEAGQFNTARAVGVFNLLGKSAERKNRHAYLASETFYSDGYFDSPQAFKRFNMVGKFTALTDDEQRISISASAFQSDWDASGQVPERAIRNGQIGRFGAIDDTEGGTTSRYNINFEHLKSLKNNAIFKNQIYYSNYQFELFSNFTFFKENPVDGDQIKQKEQRQIFGYQGAYNYIGSLAGKSLRTEIGLFFRNDQVKGNELSRVKQRATLLSRLALGNVNETNTGAFISETWLLGKNLSINGALRFDLFQFAYEDQLDTLYDPKRVTSSVASPKVNVNYDMNPKLRWYLSGGYGYHSNDSRVVTAQNGLQTLPQALGADAGLVFKPSAALMLNAAAWYLGLEQEFVYVGDEAIVEASGQTERYGIDFSARLQVKRALFVDADLTYSHARSVDSPEGENYIPLAPTFTATGGLNYDPGQGFFAGLRFRHLADRAANENNSLVATGYFLIDGLAGWRKDNWTFNVSVQNLGNSEWKEAQFETESRLPNELEPVSEIHYTPGTPLFVKAGIEWRF